MPIENRPLADLTDQLLQQPRVWVRLAAHKPQQDWLLSVLEVTLGEPPRGWKRGRWSYPKAVFMGSAPTGKSVAGWLTRGRIPLPSGSVAVSLGTSCSVERREANATTIYEPLPWPSVEWSVHVQDQVTQTPPHGELVAAGAPAFFGFDQAAVAFFAPGYVRNRNFSGREIIVREQDCRARIESVLVQPTQVLVDVTGDRLLGTSLTLSGPDGATKALTSRSRRVRLPTPGGLGDGAWLALHRDIELVDRRLLDPTWGATADVDVEIDTAARIQTLISGGEREVTEYKRELPGSDPRGVMKTVAAFANGGGGVVVFGVEDDGEIVGLDDVWTRQNVDRVTNIVSEWVRPLPDFTVDMVKLNGRGVIAVRVEPGLHTPYGVGTTDRDVRYYVRRAGTTFPASPADVRAFVHARVPPSA
jgi:hypothetical protein